MVLRQLLSDLGLGESDSLSQSVRFVPFALIHILFNGFGHPLRLRLIEKFIGYQLRWIEDEQESPSALLRFWSFSKWILLRWLPYYCCGSSRQKKRSLRGRIYLTGRICEIVASLDNHRSPKTYSAGNHAPTTSKETGPHRRRACCGHFFKRWLRAGVHSMLRNFFVMKCVTRILLNCLLCWRYGTGADRHSAKMSECNEGWNFYPRRAFV